MRPVACAARPSSRVALADLQVQGMPGRQDGAVVARVPLGRADVADAALAMLDVVPAHELSRPGPGLADLLSGHLFSDQVYYLHIVAIALDRSKVKPHMNFFKVLNNALTLGMHCAQAKLRVRISLRG